MPRRRVEAVPPDRAARLDIADLAAYLRVGDSEIDRHITWHLDHEGRFAYGPINVPVYRNALNGAAYVFRSHLDRAINEADRGAHLERGADR